MELYVDAEMDLGDIAKGILHNLEEFGYVYNERYGINIGGGAYIVFQKGSIEIALVGNRGEVLVEEKADFKYYLWVITGKDEELATFRTALSKEGLYSEFGNYL